MVRANRRNATASRSIANDASAAAVDTPDMPATVNAFASSSSTEHLNDFLLSLGSSPLGSHDTNAIEGETPNDVDVNEANDCDDTIVNDKEEDVDDSELLPNAAVNNDTMNVDAPSNDANEEEGEDTNGEENTSLDAHDDTPNNNSGEPPAELWELTKIYTTKDILKSNAVKCMEDKCQLVACSIWSSNLNPEEPWFSCLGKLLCTIMCCIRLPHNIRNDISSTLPHPHPHAHSLFSTRLPGKLLQWLGRGRRVTCQRIFRRQMAQYGS